MLMVKFILLPKQSMSMPARWRIGSRSPNLIVAGDGFHFHVSSLKIMLSKPRRLRSIPPRTAFESVAGRSGSRLALKRADMMVSAHARIDHSFERKQLFFGPVFRDVNQAEVRVTLGAAVTGEMFGAGEDAVFVMRAEIRSRSTPLFQGRSRSCVFCL